MVSTIPSGSQEKLFPYRFFPLKMSSAFSPSWNWFTPILVSKILLMKMFPSIVSFFQSNRDQNPHHCPIIIQMVPNPMSHLILQLNQKSLYLNLYASRMTMSNTCWILNHTQVLHPLLLLPLHTQLLQILKRFLRSFHRIQIIFLWFQNTLCFMMKQTNSEENQNLLMATWKIIDRDQ